MRKLLAAIACAFVAIFPGTLLRAETAVSIDYSFVDRPARLPATFAAPAGATLRFIALKAIDGEGIDGALWQPTSKTEAVTALVIGVPGSGGNFARAPISPLSSALAAKGYGMLAINTRQHDERVNTDNFLDVRRDIEAAIYAARALGYRNLVLFGHSLGNIQVQYYAANNWDSDIKAVVLAGMFANLPLKARPETAAEVDAFRRQSNAALEALRDGKEDQLLPLPMRGQPVAAQHFLTYRSEASSTLSDTIGLRHPVQVAVFFRHALSLWQGAQHPATDELLEEPGREPGRWPQRHEVLGTQDRAGGQVARGEERAPAGDEVGGLGREARLGAGAKRGPGPLGDLDGGRELV
jgi:pimeloyl-ACP methyl ester carboxylesterase